MNKGNYEELMDKFYGGAATDDEIEWLKSQGLISHPDILYAETLKLEREKKSNIVFEDFINKLPAAKVVRLHTNRIWLKRIIAAAIVIVTVSVSFVLMQKGQSKKIAGLQDVQQPDSNSHELKTVSVPLPGKLNIPISSSAEKKSISPEIKKKKRKEQKKSGSELFEVTVNGRSITNEEEAIIITRESLAMVSANLTSVNELNPLNIIKPFKKSHK